MINLYLIFTLNLATRPLTCITPALKHNMLIIILSLRQRIICIVSENKGTYLNRLQSYVIQCGHPEDVLGYTMT